VRLVGVCVVITVVIMLQHITVVITASGRRCVCVWAWFVRFHCAHSVRVSKLKMYTYIYT